MGSVPRGSSRERESIRPNKPCRSGFGFAVRRVLTAESKSVSALRIAVSVAVITITSGLCRAIELYGISGRVVDELRDAIGICHAPQARPGDKIRRRIECEILAG